MRRYERASTMLTSNRPVEDWGKLLGDAAAVSALLDRLLHHAHVLKCGPRSWRTKLDAPGVGNFTSSDFLLGGNQRRGIGKAGYLPMFSGSSQNMPDLLNNIQEFRAAWDLHQSKYFLPIRHAEDA